MMFPMHVTIVRVAGAATMAIIPIQSVMVRWCVSLVQSCAINYVHIDLGCIRILRTSSLTQMEGGDPIVPPVLGFCSDN